MEQDAATEVAKSIGAGFLGALVSLRVVSGTPWEKAAMLIGGVASSYYCAPWVAGYLRVDQHTGMVGFLLGLFGMTLINKAYEVLQFVDARMIIDAIKRKFGG